MTLKIFAFVLPLGLDTLAIAIALGLRGANIWKPAITFALFEALLPLAGLAIGAFAGAKIESAAVIAGGIILIVLGAHAIKEAAEEGEEASRLSFDSTRGVMLAGLAVSIDEIAVGFPLGTQHLAVIPVLAAIAVQAFFVTIAGIMAGRRIGQFLGKRAIRLSGTAAGAAFMALGAWLIFERFAAHAG